MALIAYEPNVSVGAYLRQNRNIGPGFYALRLCLALLVLCWHSVLVTTPGDLPKAMLNGLYRPLFLFRVPMFFCLSGFLLTGSIIRSRSLKTFLVNRVLRIFPSLWVEVLLTALILGPLVTSVGLRDYFGDRAFYTYLLTLFGRVHYSLPGVFDALPVASNVNLSLWTLPVELKCYAVLAVLIATRLLFNRSFMLASLTLLTLLKMAAPHIPLLSQDPESAIYLLESPGNPFQDFTLLSCFIAGCAAYLWRDRIPLNRWLFCLSAVSFLILTAFGLASWLVPVQIAYATVWLGMLNIPRLPVIGGGDYSYGVYLYAFPIQQTVAWLMPDLRVWYWNIAFVLPLALLAGYLSWNFIEKPVLAWRGKALPGNVARLRLAPADPAAAQIR